MTGVITASDNKWPPAEGKTDVLGDKITDLLLLYLQQNASAKWLNLWNQLRAYSMWDLFPAELQSKRGQWRLHEWTLNFCDTDIWTVTFSWGLGPPMDYWTSCGVQRKLFLNAWTSNVDWKIWLLAAVFSLWVMVKDDDKILVDAFRWNLMLWKWASRFSGEFGLCPEVIGLSW